VIPTLSPAAARLLVAEVWYRLRAVRDPAAYAVEVWEMSWLLTCHSKLLRPVVAMR
jgi:hypothetical protein